LNFPPQKKGKNCFIPIYTYHVFQEIQAKCIVNNNNNNNTTTTTIQQHQTTIQQQQQQSFNSQTCLHAVSGNDNKSYEQVLTTRDPLQLNLQVQKQQHTITTVKNGCCRKATANPLQESNNRSIIAAQNRQHISLQSNLPAAVKTWQNVAAKITDLLKSKACSFSAAKFKFRSWIHYDF